MRSFTEQVELYEQYNELQRHGALECLKENKHKMKWTNSGQRVLDIGSGDGRVTVDILKNHIPKDSEIIGCDISENMVKYASKRYKDENITFTVMDIGGEIPWEFQEAFDHVFSFYVFHWISQQEKALTNVYKMLKENGDCLLMFLGSTPVYDVFRIMAKTPKWKTMLHDAEKYVSPYHDCERPEKDLEKLMRKVGFNAEVQIKKSVFMYPNLETYKRSIQAINPFKIPSDLKEEFLDNFVETMSACGHIDDVNNNIGDKSEVKFTYDLLIAYGSKQK